MFINGVMFTDNQQINFFFGKLSYNQWEHVSFNLQKESMKIEERKKMIQRNHFREFYKAEGEIICQEINK